MAFPIPPPVDPMLAKLATALPEGDGWLFEPKWDGFRAIVFRDGGEVYIQSRDLKPLDRYFPELKPALLGSLPARAVVDGEIVIATDHGLDFDLLQLRLHPAASRVARLAEETPSSFVAFDLLAEGDRDLRDRPQAQRRAALEKALAGASGSVHVTPCSRDRQVADQWFHRFEGAGSTASPPNTRRPRTSRGSAPIRSNTPAPRTAWWRVSANKNGPGAPGSLPLGLYDAGGRLHHVGVTSFTARAPPNAQGRAAARSAHAASLARWASGWIARMPGGQSRRSQARTCPGSLERVAGSNTTTCRATFRRASSALAARQACDRR